MRTNVGGIDRVVRIVAGLLLIALALTGTIGLWGWIGIVPLVTGLFRTCPAYLPFGISTCPPKAVKRSADEHAVIPIPSPASATAALPVAAPVIRTGLRLFRDNRLLTALSTATN